MVFEYLYDVDDLYRNETSSFQGTPKPHTSPKSQQVKDDVGVQTPPFSSRPPVVMTGTKGSNALWDQVRTLKYITKELHSANMKNG